jgi:hypothetical protein
VSLCHTTDNISLFTRQKAGKLDDRQDYVTQKTNVTKPANGQYQFTTHKQNVAAKLGNRLDHITHGEKSPCHINMDDICHQWR